MALQSPASRRYARALVEAAGPDVDRVLDELERFSEALEGDLRGVLLNPRFTAEERDRALDAVMDYLSLSELVRSALRLLVRKGRIREMNDITQAFRTFADERRGRAHATVRSAQQLSPDATERLRRALEKRTGRSVDIEVEIDPTLIGGLTTRVDSMVFDGSIRSELDRLRAQLARAD